MKLMGIWGVMVAPFVLLVLNNFRQKNNFQEIYKIIKKVFEIYICFVIIVVQQCLGYANTQRIAWILPRN